MTGICIEYKRTHLVLFVNSVIFKDGVSIKMIPMNLILNVDRTVRKVREKKDPFISQLIINQFSLDVNQTKSVILVIIVSL